MALMHDDQLSYAPTFEEALKGLTSGQAAAPTGLPGGVPVQREAVEQLARQAGQAFDRYLQAMSEKRFDDAAKALQELSEALKSLAPPSGGAAKPETQ